MTEPDRLGELCRDQWLERASILEFDAGMSREDADREAARQKAEAERAERGELFG